MSSFDQIKGNIKLHTEIMQIKDFFHFQVKRDKIDDFT